MTNDALYESIESWLKEFSGLLGAAAGAATRAEAVPVRAKGQGPQMFWWRGSYGKPAVPVCIGAAAADIAAVCNPQTVAGDGSAEFRNLLNQASGVAGELAEEYPQVTEYQTWRIATSASEEIEVFVALVRPQAEAGSAVGAGAIGSGALMDVELPLTLRFGSTRMPLQQLAGLGVGSVIEFDGSLSDPVELMVNGRVIARGEAVVMQGCYALRISEIASPRERLFSAEYKASFSEVAAN